MQTLCISVDLPVQGACLLPGPVWVPLGALVYSCKCRCGQLAVGVNVSVGSGFPVALNGYMLCVIDDWIHSLHSSEENILQNNKMSA